MIQLEIGIAKFVDIFMKARKIIEFAIIVLAQTLAICTKTGILHMALPSVLSQHVKTVIYNNFNDLKLSQELSLFPRRLLALNQFVKLLKGRVITMLLITMKAVGKAYQNIVVADLQNN